MTTGASGLDLATVDKLLTTTRAVRTRLDFDRPVPPEVIEGCLELAIQAPTGTNAQTWRWMVITDVDTRAQIAELYRDRAGRPSPAGADIGEPAPPPTAQQERSMSSALYLMAHLHEVPVLVVPCVEKVGGAAGWAPSIYPAAWSLMLALRSRGLGSCMTTAHLFRQEEAAELLGVPEGFAQACMLPVAWFTGDDFKPAHRTPAKELTYWNQWGQTRA